MGTHWGGLAYRNVNGQWMIFDDPPDSRITTLLSDSREGLWIGTQNGLTYRHANKELTEYQPEQTALPLNLGTALARDSLGGLWIGTPWNGLVQYTATGEWKYYNHDEGISSLLSDKQGGLWIGTAVGLTYRSVNGNSTVYESEWPIQALESDGNNGLWIGTSGGGIIHRKANGDMTIYNTDNSGLPTNHITALATDESGGLWVGFEDGGLAYRSLTGEWTTYKTKTSELPATPNIKAIESDGTGGIWTVGEQAGGLAHLSFGQKNAPCTEINQTDCQNLLTNKRAAIIIAGGGNEQTNTLWDTTESLSNYTYKLLNQRGFLNEEIYYLSPKS